MTIILGDNIKHLQGMDDKSIDLVYMDPPYNSDRDYGEFDDRFGGMEPYLDMMRPVLEQCRRLLKKDGSIYVQCDDSAVHYLKIEMDGIFGIGMYRNDIIWNRGKTKKVASRKFARITDHILFYSNRSVNFKDIQVELSESAKDNYNKFDDEGLHRISDLRAPANYAVETLTTNRKSSAEASMPWRGIDPGKRPWNAPRTGDYAKYIEQFIPGYIATASVHARLDLLDANGFIYWTSTGNPQLKRYWTDNTKNPQDLWNDIKPPASVEAAKYPTQKPVALLERIVLASSNPGDTVLDPFMGSGTTLVAAKKLGRICIGLDKNPVACELARTRLQETENEIVVEAFNDGIFEEE